MKKIIHLLILSCKKAAALIDKTSVYKLTIIENAQLIMHKSICSGCANYQKQSVLLDKLLDEYFKTTLENSDLVVSNNPLKYKIEMTIANNSK